MKIRFFFLLLVLLSFGACKDNKDDDYTGPSDDELTDDQVTNRWMYNKMKRLYLWNENLPAETNYTTLTSGPEAFFKSILYKFGDINGDRFSWIEEDESKKVKSLYAKTNLGFEYFPINYFPYLNDKGTTYTSVGFFIFYVYEGSDAYKKGLRRGQVIYNVNGTDIAFDNYKTLFDNRSSVRLLVYNNNGIKETEEKVIQIAEPIRSPVFISKVIPNTKIGYLMYTGFERNADDDDNNFEYDIELINSIKALKSQGITDLVLDLRYNPGGYLTSAINLASALVSTDKVGQIFVKETYNKHFQDSIVRDFGANALNERFIGKVYGTNEAISSLNLSRLYVIATKYTASASELVINGLKPYMTVYHIGETTVGKDKGSMPIKSRNQRVKWQLQPLISRLTDVNGKGDYINGLTPDFLLSEWEEGYTMIDAEYPDGTKTRSPLLSSWTGGFVELGNPSEPLLAEAIAKITGVPRKAKVKSASPSGWVPVQVPKLEYNEKRQRIIIDEDKFSNYNK